MIDSDNNSNIIEGRNPVMETFRSGRSVEKLFLQKDLKEGAAFRIAKAASEANTLIKYVSKDFLDRMSETGRHQGVIAVASAFDYSDISEMFKKAEEKNEDPLILILDGIEDPHNLGAIIRTADLAGAHGVIIPKNRACGITSTVVKASAGAISYVPVARVTNIVNTIEKLKDKGLWIAASDMDGQSIYKQDLKGPLGLIIGSEGKGISRLVRDNSDLLISVPMKGHIDSLNASVAAGVILYEIYRQRNLQ